MNSLERADFDAQMKKLCIGLNVLPSPDRLQAYFDGLNKMSLIQFSRVVEACLEEHSACEGKMPTIPQVWKIWNAVRERARASERRTVQEQSPPHSRARKHVTAMMFRYIHRRRMLEKAQGNIDIEARTRAAEDLVKFLEASAADDLMPGDEEVEAMFNVAMERISDYPDVETA